MYLPYRYLVPLGVYLTVSGSTALGPELNYELPRFQLLRITGSVSSVCAFHSAGIPSAGSVGLLCTVHADAQTCVPGAEDLPRVSRCIQDLGIQ